MVGVPGRSKGCSTCRGRKIRCDLRRPACHQCQRIRHICGGYVKPTIFVNRSLQGFDLHSRGSLSTTYLVPSPPSVSPDSRTSQGHLSVPSPRLLNLIPLLHNRVLAEFVNATLPRAEDREPPLSWITSILDSASCHETLSLAGSAIGHGWIGHIEGRHDHVSQGRRCYSQAMSCLRRDLDRKPVPSSEVILATASALVLYELIEFGTYNAQGWLAHASGIETIIFQASAHAFVAGSSHSIFLFCRVVIILRSLLQRRTVFLKESTWRHVPWTLHPKDSFHQLLDLVTEATALLETCDAVKSLRPVGTCEDFTSRRLLIRIALLVSHLRCWYADSHIRLPPDPSVPLENKHNAVILKAPMKISTDRHWYPARHHPRSRVTFELLQQARLMLLYWAVVLTLHTEIFQRHALRTELYQMQKILDDPEGSQNIGEDIHASVSIGLATECADNIVKWFEFAAQDVWNSFGPAFGVFSLKAAIIWYSMYQGLDKSHAPSQADRSAQLQQAQSMLLRLVNHGSPPTWRV